MPHRTDPEALRRQVRDYTRRAVTALKAGDWPGFFLWRRLRNAAERELQANQHAA